MSSDSDFTRLATRIREAGLVVYGFGERKTPAPFVAACDKFIFTEILRPQPAQEKVTEGLASPPLKPMVMAAIEATAREDGWASRCRRWADQQEQPFVRFTELWLRQARGVDAQAELSGRQRSSDGGRVGKCSSACAPDASGGIERRLVESDLTSPPTVA